MFINVLPSAPPEDSHVYQNLQNELNNQWPDFRFQKVNEISAALNKQVGHYRAVAKRYKRAKKVVNLSAGGKSLLSAIFSSASLGSALSVVGLPATITVGEFVSWFVHVHVVHFSFIPIDNREVLFIGNALQLSVNVTRRRLSSEKK